jgi:hypothetical protein
MLCHERDTIRVRGAGCVKRIVRRASARFGVFPSRPGYGNIGKVPKCPSYTRASNKTYSTIPLNRNYRDVLENQLQGKLAVSTQSRSEGTKPTALRMPSSALDGSGALGASRREGGMKNRILLTLLSSAIALPAFAPQTNSNSSAQPAASADQSASTSPSGTAAGKNRCNLPLIKTSGMAMNPASDRSSCTHLPLRST